MQIGGRLRIILSLVLLIGITYLPKPAFSQEGDSGSIQNLIVNGGFEGGFQEDFGVGYGWGGFSNGNAVVGWNFDDWDAVVVNGQYAQRIEIKDALDLNRYAGIYQTVSVVPGKQYKLTINGLIRSEEGDISLSDYGYRLQYAVDYQGDIAWELIPEDAWQELPWDEQPLSNPPNGAYQFSTFETTITAQSDKLTIFIRGWKKWINNGSGIFNLDEISFVGPAPDGFQAPVAQTASVDNSQPEPAEELVAAEFSAQQSEHDADVAANEAEPEMDATEAEAGSATAEAQEAPAEAEMTTEAESAAPAEATAAPAQSGSSQSAMPSQAQNAELPVSGQGSDNSTNYVLIIGMSLVLVLFVGAIAATIRQRHLAE